MPQALVIHRSSVRGPSLKETLISGVSVATNCAPSQNVLPGSVCMKPALQHALYANSARARQKFLNSQLLGVLQMSGTILAAKA